MEDGKKSPPAAVLPLPVAAGEAENELMASVARVQLAAEFLSSPFFTAQVLGSVRAAVVRGLSPWLTREDAAAYVGCSASEIDRAARSKVFRCYRRMATPLFRRDDLDAALQSGRWRHGKATR